MTISRRVQKELGQAVPAADVAAVRALTQQPAKIATSRSEATGATVSALAAASKGQAWTREEHERFLVALELFPSGPWKAIADYVGSKNSRQTMTHAQKYRQKHERQQRGLRNRAKHTKPKRNAKSGSACNRRTESRQTHIQVDIRLDCHLGNEDSSPRSTSSEPSTDAGGKLTVDTPLELTGGAPPPLDWTVLFKQASVSEVFPEFEPMDLIPEMWSTNSLEEIIIGGSGRFDFASTESHTAIV